MKIEVIQIITIAEHSRVKSALVEFEPAPWINQGKQISFYARALFDSFKPDEQETKPE